MMSIRSMSCGLISRICWADAGRKSMNIEIVSPPADVASLVIGLTITSGMFMFDSTSMPPAANLLSRFDGKSSMVFPRFITLSASITTSLRVAVLTDAESAEAVMESPTALSGVSIVAEAVLA